MRIPRAAAVLLVLSASCDSPAQPHGGPVYWLSAHATAVANDTQSICEITIFLPAFMRVPPWSGKASVATRREVATTNGVVVGRDSTIVVSYAITQDANQLTVALGDPLNNTLTGTAIQEAKGASIGTWTCPATLPFGANSLLVSHNYHAVPAPSGTWDLRWLLPID